MNVKAKILLLLKTLRHLFLSRAVNHTIILEINKRQKAHEMEEALESKTKIEAEEIQRNTTIKAKGIHKYFITPTFPKLRTRVFAFETIAEIPIEVFTLKLNGYLVKEAGIAMKNIYKCTICGKYVESPWHCRVGANLLIDGKRREMLSKLVSGLLRHFPHEVNLPINSEGWVEIDELVKAIKLRWRNRELYQWVTKEHIIALALLDPKGRFEIRNNMIRARYGHTIPVKINYSEDNKITILYHGTSSTKLKSILKTGIKPMKRIWVHLTTNMEDALSVAKRHRGEPVILTVNANCLRSKGIKVFKATNTIYLVKHVPVDCIVDIKTQKRKV